MDAASRFRAHVITGAVWTLLFVLGGMYALTLNGWIKWLLLIPCILMAAGSSQLHFRILRAHFNGKRLRKVDPLAYEAAWKGYMEATGEIWVDPSPGRIYLFHTKLAQYSRVMGSADASERAALVTQGIYPRRL